MLSLGFPDRILVLVLHHPKKKLTNLDNVGVHLKGIMSNFPHWKRFNNAFSPEPLPAQVKNKPSQGNGGRVVNVGKWQPLIRSVTIYH